MNGKDKGWVLHRGKPLILHALQVARAQASEVIISYNRNEDRYRNLPCKSVSDVIPDYAGPLAGLMSAAPLVTTEFIFALPCDMPDLPMDTASRLLEQQSGAEIAVAHDGQRLQPLVFVAKTTILDTIRSYLETGDRSVRGWLGSLETAAVDFSSEQHAFRNLNEENQLQPH